MTDCEKKPLIPDIPKITPESIREGYTPNNQNSPAPKPPRNFVPAGKDKNTNSDK